MSLASDLRMGLRSSRLHFGGKTFNWKNRDYPCTASTNGEARDLGVGGFTPNNSLTLFVLQSDLPSTPQIGDFANYDRVDYKIVNVRSDPGGAFVRLELQTPDV